MRTEMTPSRRPFSGGARPRWLWLAVAAVLVLQLFQPAAQPYAAALISAPWDKLAHLAFYSLLTVLLWQGTAGRWPAAIVLAVITIGALDELHQRSVPVRHADVLDFLVDVYAGVCTTAAILMRPRRLVPAR